MTGAIKTVFALFTQDWIGLWTCWFCRRLLLCILLVYILHFILILFSLSCQIYCVFFYRWWSHFYSEVVQGVSHETTPLAKRKTLLLVCILQQAQISLLGTICCGVEVLTSVSHQNWSHIDLYHRWTTLSSNYTAYGGNIDRLPD